jgi:Big-like domain-containing protein
MKNSLVFCVRTALALLILAGGLSACDVETYKDEVAKFVGNNPPAPPPPPPPPPPGASFGPVFSEIQSNVFTPDCATSGCHIGGGAPQGLQLDAANSYASMVGVASNQDAAIELVNPGNPDNSYLIQKLEGTAATGAQMPLNAAALPQADIDVIRQWISDGAIDDRVQASNPIRVTSLSPAPGVTLDTQPSQIIAGFDRDLDASTVNAMTYFVETSGGVAIVAANISVPAANPRSAVFDLTGVVLADDTYSVRLLGLGASVILDLDGNALDGEPGGGLPSGDGVAGGDFLAQFTIATPVALVPTLDSIQATVFTPSCAGSACHDAVASAAALDLSSADASFMNLVGVASQQQAAILRVEAGDPANSYLVMKIEGAAGTRMPLGGVALDAAVIANIRQWITDGAVR